MLLSGGIDSATCLYLCRRRGYRVRALTFRYHGIASRELVAARAIARSTNLKKHRFVRLPDLKEAGEMHPARFPGLPPTYIPMRNAIFYSFAASYAEEAGAGFIIGGHNADDPKVFRDTSPGFFENLERAFWAGSKILAKKRTRVLRPLGSKRKSEVIRLAKTLGVPLELTWSCHRDGRRHCWKCDGCEARRLAFERAGVPDPLSKTPLSGEKS